MLHDSIDNFAILNEVKIRLVLLLAPKHSLKNMTRFEMDHFNRIKMTRVVQS